MTIRAGVTLGHYTIVGLLGAGGMGEVWGAEDTTLKRKVALKVLPPALSGDPERLARFQREAEAVAALNHPNIVTIYSIEEDAGMRFLTMELVEGQSLDKTIPRDGMALGHVLDIGIALADALAASHEKGITHRDVKPANVMLAGRERRVKVLDFGLAKLRDETIFDDETRTAPAITGEGRVLGTVAYMSPEQAEGKAVGARSDLFSLGVVLYELATGARPFKGDTSLSILSAILRDTPRPVTELRADLPSEFGRIVRRCLQKDQEQRFQTAKDVRNDLQLLKADLAATDSHPVHASPAPRRWHTSQSIAVGLAILLVAGFAAALAVLGILPGRASSSAAPRLALESLQLRQITDSGKVGDFAVSSDGRYVVYSFATGHGDSLRLQRLATGDELELVPATPDAWLFCLAFTPDGDSVYYATQTRDLHRPLYRIPTLGGQPRRVIDDLFFHLSVSPVDGRLAFDRVTADEGRSLLVAEADGKRERTLLTHSRKEPAPNWIAWSPNGRQIVAGVAVRRSDDRPISHVLLIDPASGGQTEITPSIPLFMTSGAWTGDGLLVAAGDTTATQLFRIDLQDGDARRITRDLNDYPTVRATPNGEVVIVGQDATRATLWLVASGSPDARPVATGAVGFNGVDWTPDGEIIYQSKDGIAGIRPDGTGRRQLTTDGGFLPRVAPDGRFVVFVKRQFKTNAVDMWRVDIDGSNPRAVTTMTGPAGFGPIVSRDAKAIIYSAGSQIWQVSPDGASPRPFVKVPGALEHVKSLQVLAISPDGRKLACQYIGNESRAHVAILPVDGRAGITELPGLQGRVQWTPDGKALTYARLEGDVSNLWLHQLAGGQDRRLTGFTTDQIFDFAWSHDGRHLAMIRIAPATDLIAMTPSEKK